MGMALPTTSADWNTLSVDFGANWGSDITFVFEGDLAQGWSFGDTFHINLTTPFTYNPAHGNLLNFVDGEPPNQYPDVYFDMSGFNGGATGFNKSLGMVLRRPDR